jgi:hypothetical protein
MFTCGISSSRSGHWFHQLNHDMPILSGFSIDVACLIEHVGETELGYKVSALISVFENSNAT